MEEQLHMRVTIVICGAVLAAAVGGCIAALPVVQAVQEARAPLPEAPTSEIARQRTELFRSLNRAVADVRRESESLALLSELLSDSGASVLPVSAEAVSAEAVTATPRH